MTPLRELSPSASIRTRLALVGALVLLLGLSIGGFAFDRLLERQLSDNLDQRLTSQAGERAAVVASGVDPATQLDTVEGETAVAVLDDAGLVLANRGFGDPSELATVAPGSISTQRLTLIEADENEIEITDLRVASVTSGAVTVVVASEFHDVQDPLGEVRQLLVISIPLVALGGGLLLWIAVGRSLRPVERLRLDAQSIADIGSGDRVHQPEHADELGRLASTMNGMLDRLDASAATLSRFVSDSSHEIRSPITNIRARIETSQPHEWEAARADIVGEVERIEALVDDLTYLARSDEGQVERSVDRIELDDLLFAEASRLQQRNTVDVDAGGVEPIVVAGDRSQIRRVIRNLVDNAERHARSTVRLAVVLDSAGECVTITVDDDGPGIAEDDRARAFERFGRLDHARERGAGGTGLGLAIVDDIARGHRGEVRIERAPLGGARFVVTLPVDAAPTAHTTR